jgi:hypothetical protein
MDTQKAIEAILDDYEHQPLQDKRTFRAYLNQPELISLSSTNQQLQSSAISPNTDNSYFNFVVNLPRPALDAKSLQLLKAIVPQAQCSIPDYALVFPYYKLPCVPINDQGKLLFAEAPTYDNLHYIRLLPTWYKPELIATNGTTGYENFGYNRTFNDYSELLSDLRKACVTNFGGGQASNKFESNDITFYFDDTLNKFIFRGLASDEENTYDEWVNTTTYNKNDIVEYLDITYVALQTTIGNQPSTSPSQWLNVSQYFEDVPIFNVYIIAGYQDPNVKQLLQTIQNANDDDDADFINIGSIPTAPYVENQTLARRLGFTWDSTGMITSLDALNNYDAPGNLIYGGTLPLFYNRMRPFNYYNVPSPPPLFNLQLGPFTGSTDSYTADGYCNLVYSSIISIYTIIVGTSTVDTQRDANLLAMIDMNCGNLGIAFGNNFIDTKLTKIQSDVYSIYVELRDEVGQPYYLTNNATTTLLLKLTYD